MSKLFEIEGLVIEYSKSRQVLVDKYTELQETIRGIKLGAVRFIKNAATKAADKRQKLEMAIEENKDLFQKPRTLLVHGVKIGFQKGKGSLDWDDDTQVVKLIKKHFPDQADILIQTEEKPAAKALANLSVADLKKIGVTVKETGDQVVIKPVDSKIDKLIDGLCKEEGDLLKVREVA